MKSVLYTDDLEAITVIDLPGQLHWFNWPHGESYRVPVWHYLERFERETEPVPQKSIVQTVEIRIERLTRNGRQHPLFIVPDRDVVAALKLDSEPLPGQVRALTESFERGLAVMLCAIAGVRR